MDSDLDVGRRIAEAVAIRSLEVWREFGPVDLQDRDRGRELEDLGDQAAQEVVSELLAQIRPEDSLFSEELPDSPDRLEANRVWIVDPIDGTSSFGRQQDDFAVHVALWKRGLGLTDAVVGVPVRSLVVSTDRQAFEPAAYDASTPLRIVTSRRHTPSVASDPEELGRLLSQRGVTSAGVDVRARGSVGIKVVSIIEDEADAYIHDAGFNQWDAAAPAAIAKAHGLAVSSIDGSELVFNQAEVRIPSFVVCKPELHEPILEILSLSVK